jgi:hypothetical protein
LCKVEIVAQKAWRINFTQNVEREVFNYVGILFDSGGHTGGQGFRGARVHGVPTIYVFGGKGHLEK